MIYLIYLSDLCEYSPERVPSESEVQYLTFSVSNSPGETGKHIPCDTYCTMTHPSGLHFWADFLQGKGGTRDENKRWLRRLPRMAFVYTLSIAEKKISMEIRPSGVFHLGCYTGNA